MEQALETLQNRAAQLGVILTSKQVSEIESYCRLLADYNSHTNLVANASPENVIVEHVLDALTLVPFIDAMKREKWNSSKPIKLIDLGSGAGLPGLILAIAMPDLDVTMIDSIAKKINFVRSVIAELKSELRVRALCQRAEDMAHHQVFRSQFNAVTARAVGTFDMVAELGMPFLKIGGAIFAQKSLNQFDEASFQAERTLPELGGKLLKIEHLDANITGKERILVIAEKQKDTPKRYPRNWALIKKEPLSS